MDDVIAGPEALEELMRACDLLESEGVDTPFVVSCARSPRGLMTNVPDMDHRRNALAYENWPHLLEHGLVPVSRSTFVSALFRRSTLERFGLPIADMFIWGEDSEYTWRVTRHAPGYIVGRSHVEHVRAVPGVLDIRTETDPVRIGWHSLQIRNRMYTDRLYQGRRVALRYAVQMGRLALSLLKAGQTLKARMVIQGVLMGFTFNPEVQPLQSAPMTDREATSVVVETSSPQQA